MLHSFDPKIAEELGINAAVIFQNIKYWVEKNEANERHFREGKFWTYNSNKAFEALFPYLSGKQIRTAIDKLEEAGLIEISNHNASGYDRTRWFCLADSLICPQGQMELPSGANGFALQGKTYKGTDSKPDSKPDSKLMPISDPGRFEEFWAVYPRRVAKANAEKAWHKAIRTADPPVIIDAARAFAAIKANEDKQFIPYPATWLNQKRWLDDLTEQRGEQHGNNKSRGSVFDAVAQAREHLQLIAQSGSKF